MSARGPSTLQRCTAHFDRTWRPFKCRRDFLYRDSLLPSSHSFIAGDASVTPTIPQHLHTRHSTAYAWTLCRLGSKTPADRNIVRGHARKKRAPCADHFMYRLLKPMPTKGEMHQARQTFDNMCATNVTVREHAVLPPTTRGCAGPSRSFPTMPLTWLYGRRKTSTSSTRPQRWWSMVE